MEVKAKPLGVFPICGFGQPGIYLMTALCSGPRPITNGLELGEKIFP